MNDDLAAGTAGPADSDAPVTVITEAPPPTSFGARLNWERERLGLTVTDVAARLRLHPNQVRAIEQESLAKLPEAAYVRGFVRSYARVLNLDPAPLLADLGLKLTPAAESVVDGMVQARDYSPVRAAAREHASRKIVMAGAVLLLIALGALGWYATHRPRPELPAAVTPAPAAIPAPSTAAPGIAADSSASTAGGASASPAPASASSDTAPAAADTASLTTPVPPAPLLKIRFAGPSWVEVKDAEGKVLLSQHSAAGAEHVIEGTPPFYVVIGDTTRATVEVRGESYDLAQYTRQNVARFTVN
jgi:cytoskeleton protein RodZ